MLYTAKKKISKAVMRYSIYVETKVLESHDTKKFCRYIHTRMGINKAKPTRDEWIRHYPYPIFGFGLSALLLVILAG